MNHIKNPNEASVITGVKQQGKLCKMSRKDKRR